MIFDTQELRVELMTAVDARLRDAQYERISSALVSKAARNRFYDYESVAGHALRLISVGVDRLDTASVGVGLHFSWIPLLRFGEPDYKGKNLTAPTCMWSCDLSGVIEEELQRLDSSPTSCAGGRRPGGAKGTVVAGRCPALPRR